MGNISLALGNRFGEAQEYAQTVCNAKRIYTDGVFPESVQKDPVRFGYAGATLESFKNYHSSEGWLRRKITAIPLAVVALVKSVAHLLYAAVPGISPDKFLSLKLRKASLFSSVRDLEESMGRVWTLFSDVPGSYHVQQALFQKKYYQIACSKHHFYQRIYVYQTPLSDLLGKSEEAKNALINQFRLNNCVEACVSLGGFWNLLQNADEEMLKLFSVDDLHRVFNKELLEGESFEIPLFLQPKDNILKITVQDVEKLEKQKDIPKDTVGRVRERLLKEEVALPDETDQKDIANMTFLTFLHLSSEILDERAPTIPDNMYGYVSEKQAETINLSKLSPKQLSSFITFPKDPKNSVARLQRTSLEQLSCIKTDLNQLRWGVWNALSPEKRAELAPIIPAVHFRYFSKDQVQKVDFSKLSDEQLQQFILSSGEEQRQKEHLPLVSLEQLSRIKTDLNQLRWGVWNALSLEKRAELAPIIPAEHFRYFSKDQVQKVDFSKLSDEQLQQFILSSGEEQRQKEHLPLVSLEQLSRIKTDLNQLRWGVWNALSPEKRAELAPIIPAEHFRYFSKDQVQKVDFSKLSDEQLQQFILSSGEEQRQKEHLPLVSLEQLSRIKTDLNQLRWGVWNALSPEKRAELAPIIPAEHFRYFSKDQVQKVDFSKLSDEQLQQFILSSGEEQRQKEHLPLVSLEQLSRIKTDLNQLHWGVWNALSPEKRAELAPIIPAEHFRYFSIDQVQKVDFSKLSDNKIIEFIKGAPSNERGARFKLVPVSRIKANKDIMDLLNADELRSLI